MRPVPVVLLSAAFAAVGCAPKSDSLYRPVDDTVSNPAVIAVGDEEARKREERENAARAREESLREQREAQTRDDDD